ncbi:MAG: lipocalin family protein [Pseudomonadota bacterium]
MPDFDEDRFLATWRVRFASDPPEAPKWLSVGILTSDYSFAVAQAFDDCKPGRADCDPLARQIFAGRAQAPGIYGLRSGAEAMDFAVVWVDPSYNTAAVAALDGAYLWLLDRDVTGGGVRLAQARSALAAAGFDTTRLEENP